MRYGDPSKRDDAARWTWDGETAALVGTTGTLPVMALRVAFQGEPGAYSEAALREYYGIHEIAVEPVPCESFEVCFEAVRDGRADVAFLPLENSLGGSIHVNFDLILRYELCIVGEHNFRVRHCLMVHPDCAGLEAVEEVISHPQALAQCDEFLREHKLHGRMFYDTAGAAKHVRDEALTTTAAVASELAAELYGLRKLQVGIEDERNNYTRFCALAKEQCVPQSVRVKTSIVFSLVQQPGVLFKALSVFALREIDLTKLESRPGKNLNSVLGKEDEDDGEDDARFVYYFYVDFLAGQQEERTRNALRHLREIAPFVRVLGSYDAARRQAEITPAPTPEPAMAQPQPPTPTVGIVGFGNFGQFLARAFTKNGWRVVATSRSDYTAVAKSMGAEFYTDPESFCAAAPDVVVMAVSILAFEKTARSFPWSHAGIANALVVDVLSVKAHPKEVLLEVTPPSMDLLCTHPMFGPESGRHSWERLPFMFERVRVNRPTMCDQFVQFFADEGCSMIEMSSELHDEYAASTQFVTHTTGRLLATLGVQSTPINTKGFQSLLSLVETTTNDSFDLYLGLFRHNKHSLVQLDALQRSLAELRARIEAAVEED